VSACAVGSPTLCAKDFAGGLRAGVGLIVEAALPTTYLGLALVVALDKTF
jgi:hypothetical protein